MNPDPGKRFSAVVGAALLVATLLPTRPALAQEAQPRAQPYWPGQYLPPGFRPVPDTNARGLPPQQPPEYAPRGFGGSPTPGSAVPFQVPWGVAPQNGGGRFPGAAPARSEAVPRLSAALSTTEGYVQQTLVLSLEVASDGNLKTIDPVLPGSDGLVVRKVGSWEARARTRDGKREIVNRLNYLITPVRPGDFDLGEVRVKGQTSNGQSFSVGAGRPLELTVLPPEPGVVPWLPLAELDVTARLINDEAAREGGPVSLIIEQHALGATGAQLPSIEPQLRQGVYRLYLEDSQQAGQVDAEGRVKGTRIDTFTLMPMENRELLIPTVRIHWWNTSNGAAETAILPSRMLNAPGGLMNSLSERLSGGPFVSGSSWVFWLPLTVFAFLTGLYWTWLWAKGRRVGERLSAAVAQRLDPAHSRLGRLIWRLSPRRHLHQLRRAFANSLPCSNRLWFCVRSADEETDPADWSQVLRFLINRRLGTPAHVPTPELAETIIRLHPQANPERIRGLLTQLDAAIFGREPLPDFARWKRAFKAEIKPRLFGWRWPIGTLRRAGALPALNP
ncbi:MAG: hypothetical protein P8106_05475 [Gammaproteobacteria bacterium]